jgi:hypothetical protein
MRRESNWKFRLAEGWEYAHFARPMKFCSLLFLLAALLCTGCFESSKKSAKGKKKPDDTKDQSSDVSFQGFVGNLKIAAQRHDREMLATMMAPNFGYRWDDAPPGEDPFSYWDKNNLWPELVSLLKDNWVPYEGYMVVPPQLSIDQEYRGYRAGVQQVNGSWKFAYFVSAPPAGH